MKLTNNLTIEQLLKTPFGHQFNIEQKSLILQAAEIGIDPMVIAKPEFDDEQMWLIIAAHKTGHDYRPFAKHIFHRQQSDVLIRGLYSQIDASLYADPTLTSEQIRLAYKYLFDDDFDINEFSADGTLKIEYLLLHHEDLSCRYRTLTRFSDVAREHILRRAPYYTKEKYDEINE